MKKVALDTNALVDLVGLCELDELRGLGLRRPTVNQATNRVLENLDEFHRNATLVLDFLRHRSEQTGPVHVQVTVPDFAMVELNDVCGIQGKIVAGLVRWWHETADSTSHRIVPSSVEAMQERLRIAKRDTLDLLRVDQLCARLYGDTAMTLAAEITDAGKLKAPDALIYAVCALCDVSSLITTDTKFANACNSGALDDLADKHRRHHCSPLRAISLREFLSKWRDGNTRAWHAVIRDLSTTPPEDTRIGEVDDFKPSGAGTPGIGSRPLLFAWYPLSVKGIEVPPRSRILVEGLARMEFRVHSTEVSGQECSPLQPSTLKAMVTAGKVKPEHLRTHKKDGSTEVKVAFGVGNSRYSYPALISRPGNHVYLLKD